MKTAADVLARLDLAPAQGSDPFHIAVGPIAVTVLCPGPLRAELMAYFADALAEAPGDIVVHLLPDQTLTPEPTWADWQRDPGKAGRKDATCDLDDARLVRKVRSGVTFLQAPGVAVAFGALGQNVSTVINFVNTQILSACLRDGWQLAHAAAVTRQGRTLAISGLSGGGKSTSILRMMDISGAQFMSNDRVLIRAGTPAQALGIPKHPRINPGTIIGNPRLRGMLSPARRAELEAMPLADLWSLEDKHDLFIPQIYGPDRICYGAALTDFWVLNWSHTTNAPTAVSEVTLTERADLLSAIMKSPGPFYQHRDGRFEPNGATPDPAAYLTALGDVRVSEVSGRVDFDVLAEHGRQLLDD
ncbi:HprK-related kinase B [Puniceibacterium sp. IMCC21224]|uniref:HprK-related kinase B n=1 Tax=Puniceibacterium sp. IMCC21224 TaxID=1618204 RepID=UPI00064D90B2|nr:HprK-related kinase B [Puniceibacterium sp. IMCC21224]KMK68831.1 HprK-related kinase B [Puniceibacterium sp. IMCC21224]